MIRVLERELGHKIEERYDIQYAPVNIPTWLHYFVLPEGYVLWVACDLCEPSEITLQIDGDKAIQTINIASPEIASTRSDYFTRDELMDHPTFNNLAFKQPVKPGFILQRLDESVTHWQDIFEEQWNDQTSESEN